LLKAQAAQHTLPTSKEGEGREERVKDRAKEREREKKDGNAKEGSRDVDWTKKTQLMDLYSI
jgi:hypothetical protein